MDADTQRIQTNVASVEGSLARLRRDVESIEGLLKGKTQQTIYTPSGAGGFYKTWKVLAQPMGAVPAEDSETINHQWKVTASDEAVEEGEIKVDVASGRLFSQGKFNTGVAGDGLVVAELVGEIVSTGSIVLAIVRDESTREVTSAFIEFVEVRAASTATTQYVALAELAVVEGVLYINQLRFDEIEIFEDLAVVQGEFKYVSLVIAGGNYYDLPES